MKTGLSLFFATLVFCGCAVVQSAVKSTFPYTATILIPQSSRAGIELSATGIASSFDQSVTKNGNNGDRIKDVKVVSAKLRSKDPSDFNIGNLASLKIYVSKADGAGELLVASRNDISPTAGNSIVLDIHNNTLLDEEVHQGKVKVRMTYRLRNAIAAGANLKFVLGLRANPGE